MRAEMEATHCLAGADIVGKSARRLDRNRPVTANNDGRDASRQHSCDGAIDTLARVVGIDLGHRHVAAIDGKTVQVDAELEPIREIFLRGDAELTRTVLAARLADIAFVERHADEGVTRAMLL